MSGSISRARSLAALVFATLFFRLRAPCCAWTGKVIGVTDGDSITVPHDGGGEQVRLWGIDCPEKRQEFGTKAKQATSTLVFGKFVQVDPVTTDRYRRMLAFVRVGDTLLNEESIRQGLTWVCTRYCDRPVCQEWKKLEKEARKARRGL